ncbi:Ubiquitin-conjugating enzyme E2 Q2 [Plecturocebus cupreus]
MAQAHEELQWNPMLSLAGRVGSVWFVDSDDPKLTSVLGHLEDTKDNNYLCQQLKSTITHGSEWENRRRRDGWRYRRFKSLQDEEEEPISGKQLKDEGIEAENLAILEKIRKSQRQDHLNAVWCLGQCKLQDNFPFDPPFVQVVLPVLSGGYVLGGGALYMELLTKQSCSSAYSIESVIRQINAILDRGKARLKFGANKNQYNLARAQQFYNSIIQIYEKNDPSGHAGTWPCLEH